MKVPCKFTARQILDIRDNHDADEGLKIAGRLFRQQCEKFGIAPTIRQVRKAVSGVGKWAEPNQVTGFLQSMRKAA